MKKILVVDDDEDIVEAVRLILTSHGFDVRTHSTGLDIPKIVKSYHPHLILLDIRLFGKLGTQICKELKQKHTLPIILFSADSKTGKQFTQYDADAFIQKPFELNEFINTISSHLN
ncbi:MAG: response regulator [Ginsengibacter sp.]